MPWTWKLSDWPNFIYNRDAIAPLEKEFEEIIRTLRCQTLNHKTSGNDSILQNMHETFAQPLTHEMLWNWHRMMMADLEFIADLGHYRTHWEPMHIVQFLHGKRKIVYEAPPSHCIKQEMDRFIEWFNSSRNKEKESALARASIAILYLIRIHPFEDGNGRIARLLAEKILSQEFGKSLPINLSQTFQQLKDTHWTTMNQCAETLEGSSWVEFCSRAILQALRKLQTSETRDFSSKNKKSFIQCWDIARAFATATAAIAINGDFANAQDVLALIGGQSETSGYLAQISSTGELTSFIPSSYTIISLAINNSGYGITAGTNPAYAALISPQGEFTPLISGSQISSVAINNSGYGMIGGSSPNYAALVTPEGVLTPLSPAAAISDVAINDSNYGIIGGQVHSAPYAAYAALVFPNATLQVLPNGTANLPSYGIINSVAINNSRQSIIGGQDQDSGQAYAALVSSAGSVQNLPNAGGTGNLPLVGFIYSVAINNSGSSIVGGVDSNSGQAYAALVSSAGSVQNLPNAGGTGNLPLVGGINSVAINDSGISLIGGTDHNKPYAALVSSSGNVQNLPDNGGAGNLPSTGAIYSVAINSAGIGIIGGVDGQNNIAYASLISPGGNVTNLSLPDSAREIDYVAINDKILASTIPQSIGSYSSAIYSQLSFAKALQSHFLPSAHRLHPKQNEEIGFLADAEENIKTKIIRPSSYSLWVEPFGSYIHLNHAGSIPKYSNSIGGALAGFDYRYTDLLFGGGVGYAFNYMKTKNQGHGKIQEELACIYSSYIMECARIDGALWGGLYQVDNVRHTLGSIHSTSATHGWILSPHLELALYHDYGCNSTVEGFVSLDWTNAWQRHYAEHGISGLNVVMKRLYTSLLQSEAGLRFYETFQCGWGRCILLEKASYINMAPFHVQKQNTFFVGSSSTFPVATASQKMQNLGSVQFSCALSPDNQSYPYGILNLEGEFGSSYKSFFGSLEIGKNF